MRALYCMLYQKCIKCIGSKRWKKKRKKKNLKPSQDPNWRNLYKLIGSNGPGPIGNDASESLMQW